MSEVAVSARTLILVTIVVIVLTVVAAAISALPLDGFGTILFIVLALISAYLILRFLMQLGTAAPILGLLAGSAVFVSAIFFVGVVFDYLTRGWTGVPGR